MKISNLIPLNSFMSDPLTKEESTYIIPQLVKVLKASDKHQTSTQLCKVLDDKRAENGMLWRTKMNGPRLRKMMNWIRKEEVLGVVGDSEGYLATDDLDLLAEQVERMVQRISSEIQQLVGTINYRNMIAAKVGQDPFGIEWDDFEDIGVELPSKKVEVAPAPPKMSNDDEFWALVDETNKNKQLS